MNESISNRGDCRRATATPDLLNRHCLKPQITIKIRFFKLKKKKKLLQALSWKCNVTKCELKIYAAPTSGSKRQLRYTVLGPCYYLHTEFGPDLIS